MPIGERGINALINAANDVIMACRYGPIKGFGEPCPRYFLYSGIGKFARKKRLLPDFGKINSTVVK